MLEEEAKLDLMLFVLGLGSIFADPVEAGSDVIFAVVVVLVVVVLVVVVDVIVVLVVVDIVVDEVNV